MQKYALETLTISSLEKVFSTIRPTLLETEGFCFQNEVASFQVAYIRKDYDAEMYNCTFEVVGDLKKYTTIRPVKRAICSKPFRGEDDEYYLVKEESVVPDILDESKNFYIKTNQWDSLWVTVKGDLPVGRHKIVIRIKWNKQVYGEAVYYLTVAEQRLPESDVTYMHWFHYDSLSAYYKTKVWGKKFNKIVDEYIKNAVAHGVTHLYLPLFSPPLNTKVGLYRKTVQLVDVEVVDEKYIFNFDRLDAFIDNAMRLGVKGFELCHLFSQWGAKCAIKVMAKKDGKVQNIFGWNVSSSDERYLSFLKAFLLEFVPYLRAKGLDNTKAYFHLSDEPKEWALENYLKLKEIVKPYLGEYKICDALSCYDFYKKGVVDVPIVLTSATKPFIEDGIKDLFVYFCLEPCWEGYSNRFMAMPSYRARVFGVQLYMNKCKGFLHWGYNYYNSALTERYLNPYVETDAGGDFPSGDSFVVYPNEDGTPLDSIRHEVFFDAFQDYRALLLLETKIGREKVENFLTKCGIGKNFNEYPKDANSILGIRKQINVMIQENV